jgi:putative MFS transporter
LFVFLSVATFFEGYDAIALTQILPNVRAEMGLTELHAGILVASVNVGTVLAFFFVRRADRWGRRRVLTITIAGYTFFTFLSGLSWDVTSLALFQCLARVFLIAEWAVAMVVAAEEFSADRRGLVIGVLQGFSSLGAVLCAGVAPLLLQTPWGWRSVYFVGVLPLVILMYARRGLRETERFAKQQEEGAAPEQPLWSLLRGPYKKRILQLALIWLCAYACAQTVINFWKEFAVAERAMTDAQVGASITIAALGSMPLVFVAGKLLDVIGRRAGAVIIFTTLSLGTFGSYTAEDPVVLTISLGLAIFGVSAVLPVLNAFNTELFPTELRGGAFALSNNLLGRIGYVLAPLAVGALAVDVGWGAAVRWTAVFPLLALGFIFLFLPETKGRELEETSAL